jgi:hypothetical protein
METGIRTLTSGDLANVGNAPTDDVGAVGQTSDGRLYRYVKAGGAAPGGSLVVSAGTVANHLNAAVAAAAAAGVTQVSVTLGATAATQDQYAGGFLVVGTDGSGVAITRRIKGNTAGASAGTITVVLDSKEPLLFALTTSNKVSLIPARENGVVASSTTGDPVGITVNTWRTDNTGGFRRTALALLRTTQPALCPHLRRCPRVVPSLALLSLSVLPQPRHCLSVTCSREQPPASPASHSSRLTRALRQLKEPQSTGALFLFMLMYVILVIT